MNLLLNMKDINKILAKTHFKCKLKKKMWKKNIFLRKHVSMTLLEVSLSCFHFSLMVSEREVKSPCFLQVWWALVYMLGEFHKNRITVLYLKSCLCQLWIWRSQTSVLLALLRVARKTPFAIIKSTIDTSNSSNTVVIP